MPLDPEAEVVMRALIAAYPDIGGTATDVGEIRAAVAALPRPTARPAEVGTVEDRRIPLRGARTGVVRIYRPGGTHGAGDRPPVIAFLHGGGWVLGDLESHDAACRSLCSTARAIVVALDYERAPENPFPGLAEDAYAAVRWVAERAAELGGDPRRVAVAGDSAGGNLAAAAALMARDRGGPELRLQLLIYPVCDADFTTRSYAENGDGYFLTERRMRWYWDRYVPDPAQRSNPYAAPLRAADLAHLPPAYIVSAEFDPLRDEAEAYAGRLLGDGNVVTLRRFDGMFHGFMSFPHVLGPSARASEEVYGAVGAALAVDRA